MKLSARRNAVKQCNGGCPSGIHLPCETPQKRESFWSLDGSAAVFFVAGPPLRAPLQMVTLPLEDEVETAAEHSEIILRPIDHAKTQVVSQTDVPRDSEFETGSELAEQFGFATEVIRLGVDGQCVRRPLCVNDIPFAAAENRADTRPRIGRKTCARNWIAQRKRS
jgi:hypothetical protein